MAASCDIFARGVNAEDYFKSQGRGARHLPRRRDVDGLVSGFRKLTLLGQKRFKLSYSQQ